MAINSVVILTKLVPMVLMYLLVSAPYTEGLISCGSVATKVAPCINYLSRGTPLQVSCCDAVKALNAAASRSTPDHQAVCGCVKNIVRDLPGLNQERLASLPAMCGVSLPYKYSPSIDCSTVKYVGLASRLG